MFKKTLADQVNDELYICERDLLEAEGVLERAEANVAMLRKRRARLLARGRSEDEEHPDGKFLAEVSKTFVEEYAKEYAKEYGR